MIAAHFGEWLELVLRWSHLIVGIAWIGASFYFNWLENRLERNYESDSEISGNLWAIHGGGFYWLQKYEVAPPKLPENLHWFKWEAYATWFTGLVLLVVMFYLDARVYLLDSSVSALTPLPATILGIASIAVSWVLYDYLCKSSIRHRPQLLAAIIFAYFSLLSFLLCQEFSGRGAFIHVGAAIGTVMVLNVMAVIIPSQKALVTSMERGELPDQDLGKEALMRSRHNNYFTLPVLFIMVSNHYPSTYSGPWNWLILIGIGVVGLLVRHYFNVRHLPGRKEWLLAAALVGLAVLSVLTMPAVRTSTGPEQMYSMNNVRSIIHERCTVCHSVAPVHAGFTVAPGGIIMDTDAQIENLASRIFTATVATRSMPIGNLTQMDEEERNQIAGWYAQLSKSVQ